MEEKKRRKGVWGKIIYISSSIKINEKRKERNKKLAQI